MENNKQLRTWLDDMKLDHPLVIAGPCSAETEDQVLDIAHQLKDTDVKAEDKLFATVDSTVRKVVLEQIPFLLTDTVGFIRKLPSHLIESFKSTLDEVREADILLHVVDISNPAFEDQIGVVNQTLVDIGCAEKSTIMVYNKIDMYQPEFDEENEFTLDQLKMSHIGRDAQEVVFISAIQKENIQELRNILTQYVKAKHLTIFPNYLKDEIF